MKTIIQTTGELAKLLLLTSFLMSTQAATIHAQQPPARVIVATAVEQKIASSNTFVATIMPLKRATIGCAVSGRVSERNFERGDRVTQGQPLVQLLTNTIQLELDVAKAELALSAAELTELKNGSRPKEIEQAKAKMLAAKARTAYSWSQRKRYQKLKDSSAIPQGEMDEMISANDDAEQTYLDLRSAYELMVEGPRKEKVDQARARVAIQQAKVEQILDRIKKYTIVSRFNGYVISQHIELGAWVVAGDPIVDVVELDEVELETFVPEQYITHIRPGTEVRVEVPSMPDRLFTGVVKNVIPQADLQARTFPVIVRVKNEIIDERPLLKAGLYARVALPTGDVQSAIMIPKDALVLGGQKPTVYVIKNGNENSPAGKSSAGATTAIPVPVDLGIAKGNLIQVMGDIKAGQQIVVEGNERLRPGQEVEIAGVK